MKSIGMKWVRCLGSGSLLVSAMGLVAGCSGEIADAENVGESAQAFSSASCGSAAADQVFTGIIDPSVLTPSTYSTCFKGYVVDLLSLNPAYSGTGTVEDAGIEAMWAGSGATTQAACEARWARAIFYKKVGSSWVAQTGNVDAYGEWSPAFGGVCAGPVVKSSGLIVLDPNASYRIAATMRTSYAGSTLHNMSISNYPRQNTPR